jgi:hypothetical protein
VALSLCCLGPLALVCLEQEEESLIHEGLEQGEKVAFSSCYPEALGLESLEQEESLMYNGL